MNPIFIPINTVFFVAVGIVLVTAGVTVQKWQYWAIMAAMVAVEIVTALCMN